MSAASCLAGLDPENYRQHFLHTANRVWPETNCYIDLWIELLNSLGLPPEAALGFTVTQDFEGDQFTFFKFPAQDLQLLFGISVQELAIYDSVELHSLEQLRRGRMVLVEVDSYYLPDTHGTSYRTTHGKTTIALNHFDAERRQINYFHNAGYFALSDEDYLGIFRPNVSSDNSQAVLFPYVEFVKLGAAKPVDQVFVTATNLLRGHLQARPKTNPVTAYQQAFPLHAAKLAERSMDFFHLYAFNTLRQIGANFELLVSHLAWLEKQGEHGLGTAIRAGQEIAEGAKTLQFQLARAVSRKRFDQFVNSLEPLAAAYDLALSTLAAKYQPA